MPLYHKLGKIPSKRHTVFRSENGDLYSEQLFGTEGFSGTSSLMYHVHRPTMIKEFRGSKNVAPVAAVQHNLQPRKFIGFDVEAGQDYLESRKSMLFNNDLIVSVSAVKAGKQKEFYKNADSDELIFIHRGNGVLHTFLGEIKFESGDYIMIPRSVIHQFEFESEENKLLITESKGPIGFPKRYLNQAGQFLESAPFCERDLKLPTHLKTIDEKGEFLIKIKKQEQLHEVIYASHPFDVVGWDGYNFPYAFSIHNFEPITGRVHQPPPVHQTFTGRNFVVCSFCPRMYDYHPEAIPAPYNHSNIDSDELLYYADGDFMSRNDVSPGNMTLHPGGIPHGPHPGAAERSIGKKMTKELAVMIDPFHPFKITEEALSIEEKNYYKSWLD